MSQYYNPNRIKNLYNPDSRELFRLSRSKIDLFINCPRCFYLDRKLGVAQPPGYPFSLNSAVDKLLKKEFDLHRAKGTTHPLMKTYGIDAVPLAHDKINEWRDSLRGGITCTIDGSNIVVTGGVDDVWVSPSGEYLIVDYKATSKEEEVTLDADWQIGYKRQMEIYQWLFRKNGYKVSKTGYFVYCNGNADKEAFDGKLEFDIKIIPYLGDDSWVEKTIHDAIECLKSDEIPEPGSDCDFCRYIEAIKKIEGNTNLIQRNIAPFTLTKQNILFYADKYDEKFNGTEDFFAEKELKDWLSEHKYLDRDKFIKLGLWKSKRPKRHYENSKNTDEFIKNITSLVFKTSDERERIESLLSINNGIKGVSWPVASTILHFAFPEKYSIMDFRVIWSLGWQQPKNYTFEFWQKYIEILKSLSDKFNLPLRVIDKALWFYSKENQK